jgi:hypothetical protein
VELSFEGLLCRQRTLSVYDFRCALGREPLYIISTTTVENMNLEVITILSEQEYSQVCRIFPLEPARVQLCSEPQG